MAAAFLIWGVIIYKVFSYRKIPDINVANYTNTFNLGDSTLNPDTITIYASYRDPFKPASLHTLPKTLSTKQIKPTNKSVNPKLSWPSIIYGGTIKKTTNGQQFALITISAETFIAEKNENIAGLKVVEIYPDSVKLLLDKENKTILKKTK